MGKSVKEGVMPKEKIVNRYYGQFAHATDDDGKRVQVPLDDSFLKIGWSKEAEHVEVAILRESDDDETLESRWHMQLDRAGINRLIRTLRQARDDAYGRDE